MTNTNLLWRLSAAATLMLLSSLGDVFASDIERMPAISAPAQVCDVALMDGGQLIGQIVNEQGVFQGNTKVLLLQQGKVLAVTQTDLEGRFNFRGLNPGVYQIDTPWGAQVCRAWSLGTAPPAARNGVVMVAPNDIVRGQILSQPYRTVVRSAALGGILTGFLYWALDNNPEGS